MATRSASIELLAPPDGCLEVRLGAAPPRRLVAESRERRARSTWLRGRCALESACARRELASASQTTEDTLLVHAAEANHRFAFELARAGVRAELELVAVEPDRSNATLTVATGSFLPVSRKLPADALARLRALVQTAAER